MYSILPYTHFAEPAADSHLDDDDHDVLRAQPRAVHRGAPQPDHHAGHVVPRGNSLSQAFMFWVSQFLGARLRR